MSIERHFLGWDAPPAGKVSSFLLAGITAGPVDLSDTMVVVPTRQAGRRLSEELAVACARRDSSLLPGPVVESSFFFRLSDEPAADEALPCTVKAAWASVLMDPKAKEAHSLLPAAGRDFAWALEAGDLLQSLRNGLAEGGYRIADVMRHAGNVVEEPERWDLLARIEQAYLDRLSAMGLKDPCVRKIEQACNPSLPDGLRRIVAACVPDPSLLAVRALEKLSDRIRVDILIHAPESLRDAFDKWGRPVPDCWRDMPVEIPDAENNLVLCADPASQAKRTAAEIMAARGHLDCGEMAIGVPDRETVPFIEAEMEEARLPVFDPADKPFTEHPLYLLLSAYADLVRTGSYRAASAFLRQAPVLDRLARGADGVFSHRALLENLDRLQNRHLPGRLQDIALRIGPDQPELKLAVDYMTGLCDQFANAACERGLPGANASAPPPPSAGTPSRDGGSPTAGGVEDAIRSFLKDIYAARKINPRNTEDKEFREAASVVDASLRELRQAADITGAMAPGDFIALLLKRLGEQRYSRERSDSVIDLEGWLELPWNPARFMIVAGMNEESVPGGRLSDCFLPDTVRRALSLRDDAGRFARDLFLMRSMIESRRKGGRICFIAGKVGGAGDPLRPSRLLFRCGDGELPGRARKLFGKVVETRPSVKVETSLVLDPFALPDPRKTGRLSVTAFRDYLACPFRFYLKHLLGMEELGDDLGEMPATDFGSMVHSALQAMAASNEMRNCTDAARLGAFLAGRIDSYVAAIYGDSRALPLIVAADSARERLVAAAGIQAKMAGEGWEIVHCEKKCEIAIGGLSVVGKIDRIDRHKDTGRFRVIDYKTFDRAREPAASHLAGAKQGVTPDYAEISIDGKRKAWIDLQLPLYALMAGMEPELEAGRLEIGYFGLPKAVTAAAWEPWPGFSRTLLDSARNCAEEVVARITKGIFWPPAEQVAYDDFERLFYRPPEECFRKPGKRTANT